MSSVKIKNIWEYVYLGYVYLGYVSIGYAFCFRYDTEYVRNNVNTFIDFVMKYKDISRNRYNV